MRILSSVVTVAISLSACSPALPGAADPPDLSVSHGCGYGFALGDEEQRVGLVLTFLDMPAAETGDVATEYELPDAAWDADLVLGYDLFSNWCDDVIEPGEPEVVIQQTLPVAGRLVVDQLPEPGTCGLASGTLFDASYSSEPDGVIPIGDIALTNETWGCFAG